MVVPIPEAVLAPDPVPLVALPSKVTKRHKDKGNETRAWAPSLGCFPINVSSTSVRSGSSSTSRSSTSSFVVVSETSQGGGSGNRAAALPIVEDDAVLPTVSFPTSWPKPPDKNKALDTLDEAALDDTADYRSQDDETEDKKIPHHFDIDKSTDDGPAPDARRSMEKQLAAAAPQRQKEILFNAVWPRIVQLLPSGTDEERLAFTNEFMNEDNGHILDCIFDPALKILGLSLMSMQLVARTRHAEAAAVQANENTVAALAQKDFAKRES